MTAFSPQRTPIAPRPGTPLWVNETRRQPIWPVVLLAMVTLLIVAPSAFSGNGLSTTNPITLMHHIAESTYTLTKLTDGTNESLKKINQNVAPLNHLSETMDGLGKAAAGMDTTTGELDVSLGTVAASVSGSRKRLGTVKDGLNGIQGNKAQLTATVRQSLKSTNAIVNDFGAMKKSLGAMDTDLGKVLAAMGTSAPAVQNFANNQVRKPVAGGDGTKYNAPNIMPGSKVMSVVLPMIQTLQKGGPLAAKKTGQHPSNILVGTLLKRQVPDGTNVITNTLPFDGYYGLPGADWFVAHAVDGF